MDEWKRPWKCDRCGRVYIAKVGQHWPPGPPSGADEYCTGILLPYDRRAPDLRVAALVEALIQRALKEIADLLISTPDRSFAMELLLRRDDMQRFVADMHALTALEEGGSR